MFPLASVCCGVRPLWASEIEADPISITKHHFPEMEHLGDITKLDGGTIPLVHVVTFGSPCQNLSQIGNRSGLAGAKSSLFYMAKGGSLLLQYKGRCERHHEKSRQCVE